MDWNENLINESKSILDKWYTQYENTKEDESQVNNLEFIKFSSNNTDETEHNKFIEMMAQRNEKEANR